MGELNYYNITYIRGRQIIKNIRGYQNTVSSRIVDMATILGFLLFGESTIQTESTFQ